MKILFFIVHPAKFWLFKYVTKELRKRGHTVDWAITNKDVLVNLLEREGWEYTNIFPEGRRKKYGFPLLSLIVNTWKTLVRLSKFMKGKKYDIVISGDIITFLAWLKGIKSFVPIDDGFSVVPEYSISWMWATKLVAPSCTDLGPFNFKKIGYMSNHEWAYINPKYFTPNKEIVRKFHATNDPYYIIRLVSLTASHDLGKRGLSNEIVVKLIKLLEKHGRVYINAEIGKTLPAELEKYRLAIDPYDMHHAMYFSSMFIGDSQTMASEAGLMGVPTFRCNDFVGRVSYLEEEQNYGLVFNYKPEQFEEMMNKVEETLKMKDSKKEWKDRLDKFVSEHIDTTEFYVNLIESYDRSKR